VRPQLFCNRDARALQGSRRHRGTARQSRNKRRRAQPRSGTLASSPAGSAASRRRGSRAKRADLRGGALPSRRLSRWRPAAVPVAAAQRVTCAFRAPAALPPPAGEDACTFSRRDASAPPARVRLSTAALRRSARFSRDPRRRDAAEPAGEDASVPALLLVCFGLRGAHAAVLAEIVARRAKISRLVVQRRTEEAKAIFKKLRS
jgi:hypothetical protein